MTQHHLTFIAAARPNFMKIAPLIRACETHSDITFTLIHTGQHYDPNMSDTFFKQLQIPTPHVNLEIGGGSHAEQTGKTMIAFEKHLKSNPTDLLVVVGDVNATLACSLTAKKLCIPVAHIEAGLRSFDRNMPEEINRLATDAISDILYTPSPDADAQLIKEGHSPSKICCIGNVMIDTLLHNLEKARNTTIDTLPPLPSQQYCLLTLHRPSNVDEKEIFENILKSIKEISTEFPIIFPAHPRTQQKIKEYQLEHYFNTNSLLPLGITLIAPVGYLEMIHLTENANVVLTDSGGIQEETTVLGVPCITIRENTERPITVSEGSNTIVGTDPQKILKAFHDKKNKRSTQRPALWDGKAAERFLSDILTRLD